MKESIKLNSLKPFMDVTGLDVESDVLRKRFSSKITVSSDEEKTCTAFISTMSEDADGDVIIPSGADLKRFEKNPVIMYAHNYSGKPVAKAIALNINEDGIIAKMKFADTDEANDVWSLIKGGFLNANSIGFIVKERFVKGTEEFNKYIKDNKVRVKDSVQRIISKFELLESSIVPIPCNPDALVMAISSKSINLSEKTLKELDLPKVVVIKEEVKEAVVEAKIEEPVGIKGEDTQSGCICDCSERECTCIGPDCDGVDCNCDCHNEKPIKVQEPQRYIKVIRSGGVDVKKLVELKKLAKTGKVL